MLCYSQKESELVTLQYPEGRNHQTEEDRAKIYKRARVEAPKLHNKVFAAKKGHFSQTGCYGNQKKTEEKEINKQHWKESLSSKITLFGGLWTRQNDIQTYQWYDREADIQCSCKPVPFPKNSSE